MSSTVAPSLFPVSSTPSPSQSNNNGNPFTTSGGFGSGAGYFQTIVIGLVAGGVLALAVMSLLYRRHRRRMQRLGHVRIVNQGQRRTRGGKLEVDFGKEPELWDSQIGEKEGGLEISSWQPLAVSLPPSEAPGVQMTFLIAMPDPTAPHSETPVVYDDDMEDLPPMELAVADINVPASRAELHELLPELTKKRLLLQSRGIAAWTSELWTAAAGRRPGPFHRLTIAIGLTHLAVKSGLFQPKA